MADKLTQKLVDIRHEFGYSKKTLKQYKDELLTEGEYVNDYDVEQLFPLAFPKIGLIILNVNSGSGCNITCSSSLLENKEKYIVLLFQRDPNQDKDNGAHYDLISINSKLLLPFGELSDKLISHIHKQCKTIHLKSNQLDSDSLTKGTIEKLEEPKETEDIKVTKDIEEPKKLEEPKVTKEPKKLEEPKDIKKLEEPKDIEDIEETKTLDGEKNVKLDTMKKDEIKQVLKDKGYTGLLPKYKTELIDLYKKLYVKPIEKEQGNKELLKPLDKMTIQEIQTELQKKNITKYLPRTKAELIKLYNADRCEPIDDKWCSEDKICDLRNNVCMDKQDIKPTKNTAITFETINNHQVAGTSANLFQMKHAMKNKKVIEPISLTIPQSVEGNVIQVKNLEELKTMLNVLTQQNSFYKMISQLV